MRDSTTPVNQPVSTRSVVAVLLVVALLLTLMITDASAQDSGTTQIDGSVTAAGQPITDVFVSVDPLNDGFVFGPVDADGNFSVPFPNDGTRLGIGADVTNEHPVFALTAPIANLPGGSPVVVDLPEVIQLEIQLDIIGYLQCTTQSGCPVVEDNCQADPAFCLPSSLLIEAPLVSGAFAGEWTVSTQQDVYASTVVTVFNEPGAWIRLLRSDGFFYQQVWDGSNPVVLHMASDADLVSWYPDADGDGFGYGFDVAAVQSPATVSPGPGFVPNSEDCYDDNRAAFHGAPDIPGNGIAEDCVADGNAVSGPTCMGYPVTINMGNGDSGIGTSGNDVILGTAGDDVIRGAGGHDVICAGAGVDDVFGGAGNDLIQGGDGNDDLRGQDDNDDIRAGNGDDAVFGGAGTDLLRGGAGADLMTGGEGNDVVYGHDGDDDLRGDAGDDTLYGALGDDSVRGGSGDDLVSGGQGNDSLWGHDGDDSLLGNAGTDTCYGGADVDTATGCETASGI